jgi:acyl-CoA dehydrogenase
LIKKLTPVTLPSGRLRLATTPALTGSEHDVTEQSISREAAIAKLYSTETAFEIIDQAVQIFGGLGVIRGTTVERLFRHSRAFRIFDGTSEIQQLIIARNLLQHR